MKPEKLDFRKVRFEVQTHGTMAIVKAFLPPGFTMREYTRMYDLRHAKEMGMTDKEYAEYQHGKLKEDLMARIPSDKRKLIG